MNKKDKRKNHQGKDKPLTVSLKDFQSEGNTGMKSVRLEELFSVFIYFLILKISEKCFVNVLLSM